MPRRRRLETCSILGAKSYEYEGADFRIFETVEHKTEGNGYRPAFRKTQTFNFIWVCQIMIKSSHKLIEVESSRYAWLKNKMIDLTHALVWVD